MKFLKQGICLALLGAGLTAAPMTLAGEATATPAPSTASAAQDHGLVQEIRSTADGTVAVSNSNATGAVGFAKVSRGGDLLPGVAGDTKAQASDKAGQYLAEYGGAFGAGAGQLKSSDVISNGHGGWTVSYTQAYQGVPVFGALLRAHVDGDGSLTAVNGYAAPDLDLSTDPRLSAAQAGSRAVDIVKTDPGEHDGAIDLSGLEAAHSRLTVYRTGVTKGQPGKAVLAYVVEVTNRANVRDMVFIDAQSGKMLNRYATIHNDLYRIIYEQNTTRRPVWEEGDPFPGTLNQDQQNLVEGTGESYWFFANVFGRDSYDDGGAEMRTVNNDPRISCPNANWNGVTTNYCNGVTSDDVVSHEWGHAYTEYTHGLIYQWQSGALNESYSDIWGETIDLINGRMDEEEGDITTPRVASLCAEEGPRAVQVVINSPANIAKVCLAGAAAWGATPDTTGVTSDIVLAVDPADAAGPSANDGCSPLTNAAAMAGHVGLVVRGTCAFTVKAQNLVAAGATAVVIGNNNNGGPFAPGGSLTPALTVPVVGISQADSDRIRTGLAAGVVNTTVRLSGTADTADSFRWLMGEDSTAFGGAIRDMWVPTCAGDPGKVSDIEYACGTDDGGGVHSNSGVPNHGYALLVDGGTFNGVTVTGLGLDKAAAIYYQAMTQYQTPTSNFADHADALEASCADLVDVPLVELTVEEDATPVDADPVAEEDCDQVSNMIAAVELRKEPTQCNFQPLLKQGAPALCGAGTKTTSVWSENFEDGLVGWEKDSEIVFPGGISTPWTGDSTPPGGRTGGVARGVDDPHAGACTNGAGDASSRDSLISPSISMPSVVNAPKLSFDHYVATEFGYDGGNVKVSVNGGSFAQVPASAFVFNGYNSTLQPTNPLGGEAGFTGTDGNVVGGSWGTTIIDLAAMGVKGGDTLRLRFDMGRDGCGGLDGWYVDNVSVTSCDQSAVVATTTSAKAKPGTVKKGKPFDVKVEVTAAGGTPVGMVEIYKGDKLLGTGTLGANGKVTIKISKKKAKKLKVGKNTLTAKYLGSSGFAASQDSFVVKVKNKH